MQFSIAQLAANELVDLIIDEDDRVLSDEFGQLVKSRDFGFEYVSDWLHLALLSGLAHRVCLNDALTYMSAVSIVLAEMSISPGIFPGLKAVPIPPEKLALIAPGVDATFASSPEFLLPAALTPEGFEITKLIKKEERLAACLRFAESPDYERYGFPTHVSIYGPPASHS